MYLNKKERDAIHEAVDFISSNTDGAEDRESFENLMETLNGIWKKSIKELVAKRYSNKSKSKS